MLFKIGSVLIVLSVSYVLGVFFAPAQTDEIGKVLGISEFNQVIRDAKAKLDGLTDTVSKIKDQSGGLIDTAEQNIKMARDTAAEVQGAIQTTKDTIQATKETVETKVNQGRQIIDTANSLKEQIDTFTTLSGAMTTASGSATASGATGTGVRSTTSGSVNSSSK